MFIAMHQITKYKKNVFLICRQTYHKIPFVLQFLFSPIKLLYWLVKMLKLKLWIIKGIEVHSKGELIIFYAGTEENKNFILKLAFNNSYKEKYIGQCWLWNYTQKIKKSEYNSSLSVCEVPHAFRKLFGKKNCIYVPCWIDGDIDISSSIKTDSIKTDMRRIKKNKLNYEVTNELNQFDYFYHQMYVPYITKTFGSMAVISNYDFLRSNFRKRGLYRKLLLIKKNNEFIAGTLLGFTKNKTRLSHIGVKNGDRYYVKEGAIGALFYFPIIYSKEKGFERMSFGLARTFLNDGVLQFKKKRGMHITDTTKMYFRIITLSGSISVKGFFLNNPFIYMNNKKLNGAIFIENNHVLNYKYFERIYKDYFLKGISKLVIYHFGNLDNNTIEIVPREFSENIKICSADSLFGHSFSHRLV